jgi:hypothetical protein
MSETDERSPTTSDPLDEIRALFAATLATLDAKKVMPWAIYAFGKAFINEAIRRDAQARGIEPWPWNETPPLVQE